MIIRLKMLKSLFIFNPGYHLMLPLMHFMPLLIVKFYFAELLCD